MLVLLVLACFGCGAAARLSIIEPRECSEGGGALIVELTRTRDAESSSSVVAFHVSVETSADEWSFDIPPTEYSRKKRVTLCRAGHHEFNQEACFYPALIPADEATPGDAITYTLRFDEYFVEEARFGAHASRLVVKALFQSGSFELARVTLGPKSLLEKPVATLDASISSSSAPDSDSDADDVQFDMSAAYEPFRLHQYLFEPVAFFPRMLSLQGFTEEHPHVYSFELFTPQVCHDLAAEIANVRRRFPEVSRPPNSMNKRGFVTKDYGLDVFLSSVMHAVQPFMHHHFQGEWGTERLDSHHSFVISYEKSERLSYHMDQSAVTINLSLPPGNFTGGEVWFKGVRDSAHENTDLFLYKHRPCRAIMHVGQMWHGANPLGHGVRNNLIMWLRSSAFNKSPLTHFREQCEPK